MSDDGQIRVAIIGGGCAGMAAAFELTRPALRGKYQVTVYQQGHRLGGKGASGRGVHDRIEEHGLHLWMGFYENAFRLMRECYIEAGRDPARCPLSTIDDAFIPSHFSAIADRMANGQWDAWGTHLPAMPGMPGEPHGDVPPRTIAGYVERMVALVRSLLMAMETRASGTSSRAAGEGAPATPAGTLENITRVLGVGRLATFAAVLEATRLLQLALSMLGTVPEGLVTKLLDLIQRSAHAQVEQIVLRDDGLRRLWEIVDMTLACVRGAVRFGLLVDPRGFDAIDDYDCREWLLLNGASQSSVDSAFVRGLYDLAFAYERGDVTRPRIAAGQAMRGALRAFFTYRGAFFFKMTAGMGDVVFAPFYEVLRARGVHFEFFHRLTHVALAEQGDHVRALHFDVQARTREGEYRPLVDVRGIPSWPAGPDFAQLVDGARLCSEGRDFESHWDRRREATRTLEVGRDFDFVVLAIGVAALPEVCGDILARDARWRTMIERVTTVQTQAFQLWLSRDMPALGWPHGSVSLSGFVEPFDTWADMTHLVPVESQPDTRAIAYFCSVLPDVSAHDPRAPDYPARLHATVRQNVQRFLDRDLVALWPRAAVDGHFVYDALVGAPEDAVGAARLDSQFFRANVNPSDRYTLSLPGSLKHRISPLDATYDNMTVAGDWTDCGFNEGCVEAAVMSGRLAAHALSQSPPLHEIVGFDHP